MKNPFRRGNQRGDSAVAQLEEHEMDLLKPFLEAEEAELVEVKTIIEESKMIPDERKPTVLARYVELRSARLAGMGGKQEREGLRSGMD